MSDWSELSETELKELCADESLERRGKALETLGMRHAYRCDYATARTYLEQAVSVNDQVQDLEWSSTSRQLLGRVFHHLGDYGKAIDWFNESILGFQNLLWDRVVAETLHYRAISYRDAGFFDLALDDFDDAFSGFLAADKPVAAADIMKDKADLEIHLGWYRIAHATVGRALQVLRTEPEFTTRLTLHTSRLHTAALGGLDVGDDIIQGDALRRFVTDEGVLLEWAAWKARWFIAHEHFDNADDALSELEEEQPDSHARLQRVETLKALLAQARGGDVEVSDLETAYLIATSYKDARWLPVTTKLLALCLANDGDPTRAAWLIGDALDAVGQEASRADVFDLWLLLAEIDASTGRWEIFETLQEEHPIPFDDRFVDSFGRLLILATLHAIDTKAHEGEIIQRLKAATAQTWLLPDEYRPRGMSGIIPEDSHVLITVPDHVRHFGFTQAKDIPHFQTTTVMEKLGEVPLGHPVFHMDLAFLR